MKTARIASAAGGIALLGHASLLLAAEGAPLTQGEDVITAAGIVRVVVVFALVAGLGVAVILGLRRVLPRVSGAPLGGGALRIVERTNLGPATRVHLVQVDGERILVAESRTALAMVVLSRAAPQPPP